jgi:hypothetical protein
MFSTTRQLAVYRFRFKSLRRLRSMRPKIYDIAAANAAYNYRRQSVIHAKLSAAAAVKEVSIAPTA